MELFSSMDIDQLLLSKEEILIKNKNWFMIPIHPALLKQDIVLDPRIANNLFPQVAKEWYSDLKQYVSTAGPDEKRWFTEVHLKEEPKIDIEYDRQVIRHLGWEDMVMTTETGFARVLSINRNFGGTLYINDDEPQFLYSRIVQFSPEKLDAYAAERFDDGKGVLVHSYQHHNVDHYPGALFLRNWAIAYLNEAMRSVDFSLFYKDAKKL